MGPLEMFAISFFGSFLGSIVAIIVTLYLYKKQIEQMKKMEKSLQATVRRLKKGVKK